jgi:hypothetical protein
MMWYILTNNCSARRRNRLNPLEDIPNEREFKARYRFSKVFCWHINLNNSLQYTVIFSMISYTHKTANYFDDANIF